MKDIRIGNDIIVKWSIFGDGAPYILEGKDVSLYLCTPFGKRKAEGFSIVGNQITWTFAGKDQSRTGKYSLELVVNADKEGQVTTDACNFVNLVNCSCKVGGTDESNVEIESISLTSELGFLPYDDTEIRNEIKKKQDALVSGENIKTINNQSILGEGNIEIKGGGATPDWDAKEGEEGYIKNRTHYLDWTTLGIVDVTNVKTGDVINLDFSVTSDTKMRNESIKNHLFYNFPTDGSAFNLPVSGPSIKAMLYGSSTLQILSDSYGIPNLIEFGEVSILPLAEEYIPLTIARSEELAKLSEKVDELGQPIFKAIYGTTKYEEIKAAYDSGKVVHCDYESNCYILSRFISNEAYFSCVKDNFSYRLYCSNVSVWSKASFPLEKTANKTTTINESSTDTQYPSAKAVFTAIGKKSEVSLEALANGNLKVTINGESKDFMPATPSGDPMHYMFEAAGATYNATDADIPMVGIYGDSYVHKAKHWHLNELGDLTTEEIRNAYSSRYPIASLSAYQEWFSTQRECRTNMSKASTTSGVKSYSYSYYSTNFENIKLGINDEALINVLSVTFGYSAKLKKILTTLNVSSISNSVTTPFLNCTSLKEVRVKGLKVALPISNSPLLSEASILYMIQNEAATSAIVITLHADAYARAMADTEITAALAAHPNVSLASA